MKINQIEYFVAAADAGNLTDAASSLWGGEIDLLLDSSGSCLAAIEDGTVDGGLIFGPATKQTLTSRLLQLQPLHAIASQKHPLSNKSPITFFDLAQYKIAKPHDIRHCLPLIAQQLETLSLSPSYTHVSVGNEHHFINEEHGIIFTTHSKNSLSKCFPEATILPLRDEEGIVVPLYYVTKRDNSCPFSRRIASLLSICLSTRDSPNESTGQTNIDQHHTRSCPGYSRRA